MTDINIGAISEALNDKTDRDMRNVDNTAGADAVVEYQAPDPNNDYKWYRKYASGWVEQGGIAASGSSSVTFPITMADTQYTIIMCLENETTPNSVRCIKPSTRATTSFGIQGGAMGFDWEVKGIAA